MEKIDEAKDGVQAAEIAKAEPEKPAENAEVAKLRAALSRANSEAAEWKKALREKQTEQERKEAELAEQRKLELEELETLRKEKRINGYKARLMEAGVDPATADLMANALPDGVGDDYFTAVKTFNTNQRQALETEALNKQPKLSVGTPPSGGSIRTEDDAKYDRWFGLN